MTNVDRRPAAETAWTDERVLELGGYGADAQVLAWSHHGDIAAALTDTNGDGRLIQLDTAWRGRSDAAWEAGDSLGAGLEGSSVGTMGYVYGSAAPGTVVEVACKGEVERLTVGESGWWLRVWPGDGSEQAAPTSRVVSPGELDRSTSR